MIGIYQQGHSVRQGATRQKRIVCDIMIGDRFYKTFRGYVNTHPCIDEEIGCIWKSDEEDIHKAILAKYPSLKNKNYKLYIC